MVEGARLESVYAAKTASRVRIPFSPPRLCRAFLIFRRLFLRRVCFSAAALFQNRAGIFGDEFFVALEFALYFSHLFVSRLRLFAFA